MSGAAAAGTRPAVPGLPVTMMTSERQIWEAAMLLVRRHGEDAADIAGREAKKHGDDELTYVVWCWIARATAELIKAAPDEGDRVH
jgi:hypothetical protein